MMSAKAPHGRSHARPCGAFCRKCHFVWSFGHLATHMSKYLANTSEFDKAAPLLCNQSGHSKFVLLLLRIAFDTEAAKPDFRAEYREYQ